MKINTVLNIILMSILLCYLIGYASKAHSSQQDINSDYYHIKIGTVQTFSPNQQVVKIKRKDGKVRRVVVKSVENI